MTSGRPSLASVSLCSCLPKSRPGSSSRARNCSNPFRSKDSTQRRCPSRPLCSSSWAKHALSSACARPKNGALAMAASPLPSATMSGNRRGYDVSNSYMLRCAQHDKWVLSILIDLAAHSYESVERFCPTAVGQKRSTLSRHRLASEPGQVKKHLVRSPTLLGQCISSCIKLC